MWLMAAILGNIDISIFITQEIPIGQCQSRGNDSSSHSQFTCFGGIDSTHSSVDEHVTENWPIMVLHVTPVIIRTKVGTFIEMTTNGILFPTDVNLSLEWFRLELLAAIWFCRRTRD